MTRSLQVFYEPPEWIADVKVGCRLFLYADMVGTTNDDLEFDCMMRADPPWLLTVARLPQDGVTYWTGSWERGDTEELGAARASTSESEPDVEQDYDEDGGSIGAELSTGSHDWLDFQPDPGPALTSIPPWWTVRLVDDSVVYLRGHRHEQLTTELAFIASTVGDDVPDLELSRVPLNVVRSFELGDPPPLRVLVAPEESDGDT